MKLGYQHLASAMVAKGDPEGAVQRHGEGVRQRDAGGESMDRRRGLLLSETRAAGRSGEVLKPYGESEDPETLNALGIVLTDAGRPAESLPFFARAVELDPAGADGYQNTGIALLKLDRAAEARDNLEQALRFGKRHARAWNALGVAWLKLGDPRQGRRGVGAMPRALNPEQYDALYNIGRVAGQIKDWKKARAALEKFAATPPPKQYGKDSPQVRAVLADMKQQGL